MNQEHKLLKFVIWHEPSDRAHQWHVRFPPDLRIGYVDNTRRFGGVSFDGCRVSLGCDHGEKLDQEITVWAEFWGELPSGRLWLGMNRDLPGAQDHRPVEIATGAKIADPSALVAESLKVLDIGDPHVGAASMFAVAQEKTIR